MDNINKFHENEHIKMNYMYAHIYECWHMVCIFNLKLSMSNFDSCYTGRVKVE